MTFLRVAILIALLMPLIGCLTTTPTVVGTWRVDGRDDQTLEFHEDGSSVWKSIWPMGAYGEGRPTMVPVDGTYKIGPSNRITMQTKMMGVPPHELQYILSADRLEMRSTSANGAVTKYHRVQSEE